MFRLQTFPLCLGRAAVFLLYLFMNSSLSSRYCQWRSIFFILVIVPVDSTLNCGKSEVPLRDLSRSDGTEAFQGSWPWQVHIKGPFDCGGVLISPLHVLTIAHCAATVASNLSAQLAPSQLTVFAGLHDRSNLEHKQWQLRKVAKIRIHPNFKHETEHADIALLTLDKQIEIDQFVNAVCVTKHLANPNSHCYATGYGVEDKKGKESYVLRQLEAPYLARESCHSKLAQFSTIVFDETKICAGDLTKGTLDSCYADNGGPLVCKNGDRWELQGLVSRGTFNSCGRTKVPTGVYVNVPNFYNWLMSETNNAISAAPETATKATLAQIIVPSSDTKYVPSSEWFCFQASGTASAEFRRNITLNGRQFQIVCDSKTDGGGWLVLSRRLSDNTVQFHNRPEPDMGWGDISSDFWLGTEIFHQLTSGPYKIELLMDMKLCDKNQVFRRKYKNFSVGNKQSGYELRVDRSPGEDDREGLSGSNGRPNRCFDEVGRQHGVSCWWWSTHPTVSINAEIGCDIPPPINNFWFTWKPQRRFQIKTVEMKIRPMPIGTPAQSSNQRSENSFISLPKTLQMRRIRNPAKLSNSQTALRHCQEIYKFRGIHKSGTQMIRLDNGDLKEVYCEMEIDGGGWTLIQRRQDGKENFERVWDDFAMGFGVASKDFWLGNSAIHLLTKEEDMELRLDMQLCSGEKFVVKYRKFQVGPAESRYQLVTIEDLLYAEIGQWRYADLTEGLMYNKGWEFTTATDSSPENCVKQMGGGGWWYNACGTFVNLNGKFGCNQPHPQGNYFYFAGLRQKRAIKTVAIMIRPFDVSVISDPGPLPLPPPEFPYGKEFNRCDQILAKDAGKNSGAYKLEIGENPAFVYCDMTTDGGGWMTLLRRENGMESFSRDWIDYTEGFGNAAKGDYWVGLRGLNVYYAGWDLRLEITWCHGGQSIFQYRNFALDDGAKKFRLTVNGKSDGLPDPFSRASGKSFHTANWGISTPNCGNTHGGGGWWWTDKQNCTDVNLTGKFGCEVPFPQNLYWVTSRSAESLKKNGGKPDFQRIKTVQMKIRPPR